MLPAKPPDLPEPVDIKLPKEPLKPPDITDITHSDQLDLTQFQNSEPSLKKPPDPEPPLPLDPAMRFPRRLFFNNALSSHFHTAVVLQQCVVISASHGGCLLQQRVVTPVPHGGYLFQ